MKIYNVKTDVNQYKILNTDIQVLTDALSDTEDDDDMLMRLMGHSATTDDLKPIWKTMSFEFEQLTKSGKAQPDISHWMECFLLLNQKAYDMLKELLAPMGEFLPLEVNAEPHYVLNVQKFGQENKDKMVYEYDDGEPIDLLHLEFVEDGVKDMPVFKNKYFCGGKLFCTEVLKTACETHGLQGLYFDTDLLSPFC